MGCLLTICKKKAPSRNHPTITNPFDIQEQEEEKEREREAPDIQ